MQKEGFVRKIPHSSEFDIFFPSAYFVVYVFGRCIVSFLWRRLTDCTTLQIALSKEQKQAFCVNKLSRKIQPKWADLVGGSGKKSQI